ncbi:MAG: response regulator [Acidobacteriota bacterium]|nr:response regulator [Acidobacteriota bacterium]
MVGRATGDEFEDALRSLRLHFHGLAGAGDTYGFSDVSGFASRGEAICARAASRSGPATPREAGEWLDLTGSIRTALDAAAPPDPSFIDRASGAEPAAATGILVVMDDLATFSLLRQVLEREGFVVRSAASVAEARRELERELPAGVLLDARLPDGRAADLVESIRGLAGGDSVAVILVAGAGDFTDRVEAIHCGADGYFCKPVDVGALLRRLHHLLGRNRRAPARVLSVEDQGEVSAFHRAILESAGYEVRVCADPARFESDLASFRPDLVLLDARLSGGKNGHELARYLRQEERYATLPVIFLAAKGEPKDRIAALRSGGDDLLVKPIPPALLLTMVAVRLERARFVGELLQQDGLTRLLTHTAFFESVRTAAIRLARAKEDRAALVLVDVDGLGSINDRHGHAAGDRVLRALGSLLKRRLRQSDTIGRLRDDELGFLLHEVGRDEATRLVDRIAAEFREIPQLGEGRRRFRASFSSAVMMFDPETMDAKGWLAAADAALRAKGRPAKAGTRAATASAAKKKRRSPPRKRGKRAARRRG